jgi:hypothetical protein
MLYIWFRPQGSKRDGIRKTSCAFDEMRERFVEANLDGETLGIGSSEVAPHLFVRGFPVPSTAKLP